MSSDEYRRALRAAVKEYEQLGVERQRIDKRLSELVQTIGTLSRLCGLTPTVPWGLTDACRTVLRNGGVPMTAADVRDRLQAIGCDLSSYANALAAIHTTLKRLAEAGELRTEAVPPRKVGYLWQRAPNSTTLSIDNARIMREIEQSYGLKRAKR
ncbi:MAG: hypothetical protein ACRD2X_22970 [Vicinamibacteraceae bacterium]